MVMLGVIAGSKHVSMQLSRTFSGLTNLLFNRRCVCNMLYIFLMYTNTRYSNFFTSPHLATYNWGQYWINSC